MMIIAAIFETVSIGVIVPFVGIITNPEIIFEQAPLTFIYELLNFNSSKSFIIFTISLLLIIFIMKNIYLLLFYNVQFKIISNQRVKLSIKLFKEYLIKPYTFHLQRNSAQLLRNVSIEVTRVFEGIIIPGFQLITESLVILFILVLLLFSAPIATIVASALLVGSVFLFFKVFQKKTRLLGKEQQLVTGEMIKWVKQGLGATKEVKVSGKEGLFLNAFEKQSVISINNSRYLLMLNQVPRLFIETILVATLLVTILIIIFQGSDTTKLISTLALFAMASFRLMPSISRIMNLVSTIQYYQSSLGVVYEDLFLTKEELTEINSDELELDFDKKRIFHNSIELKNLYFRYPNQEHYSIKDVSLTIPIGKSVALIGESGAGKTTIVDIVLGLLEPEEGEVLVDGKKLKDIEYWKQKIGYIPQSIFLTDDSIRNNVAFGFADHEIDDDKVWMALDQARLKEFVLELPEKLSTSVGERGIRLSGGQRQRIGIARALYHNPEILFMDEATSSLDNETEKEIMEAIDGLKGEKTLIIIAHRLSTIENCDIVFGISKGELATVENKLKQPVM